MIFHIYPDPKSLEDIRIDIDAVTAPNENSMIDLVHLNYDCPLLVSMFQETLWYRSIEKSINQVMQDLLIDNGQ